MAADAGLDVLFAAFLQLDNPFGIDEVLTRDGNGVDSALGNRLRRNFGLHLAAAGHRDVHELLDVRDIFEVAVVGHVLRRMCPVPSIVSTVVAVEMVVAGILQVLDSLLGLGHVAAELDVLFAGNSALEEVLRLGDDGVTQGHREVGAGVVLDALDDIGRVAISVLEGSTVLVGAVVPVLDRKLVEGVAFVHSVDLHAVDASLAQQLRGLTERSDALLDLGSGEHLGVVALQPAVRGGGSGSGEVLHVQNGFCELVDDRILQNHLHHRRDGERTAAACCQLNEQLAAGLVEVLHVLCKFLIHSLVLVEPSVAENVTHPLHAGDNQTDIILCFLQEVVSRLLVKMVRLHPAEQGRAAHGAVGNAVFQFHIANFPRGK